MFLERMADRMQKGEAQVRRVEPLASGSTHGTDRGEDSSSRGGSNKGHSKQKSKGIVITTGSTRTGEGGIRADRRRRALISRSEAQASAERISDEVQVVRRMEKEKFKMGDILGPR